MSLKLRQAVAVVLAGGFGTRVSHLLTGVPKPMAPVAGRPFLEWVVRCLARQGIPKVLLSTGYMAEVGGATFPDSTSNRRYHAMLCRDPGTGTGGGFFNAVRLSGESPEAWLVLNGDSLVFADLNWPPPS